MLRARLLRILVAAGVGLAGFCPEPALAAEGKVSVTISGPNGVPANVILRGGGRHVLAKPASGRRARVAVSIPARRYAVQAPMVSHHGRTYVATRTKKKIRVRKGRTVRLRVRYRAVPSASGLRPTKIEAASLSLAWDAPKRASFALRRAAGSNAPTGRTKGTAVRARGRVAIDAALKPGQQYSYALFTRVGRRWTGPIVLSARTAPPAGSTDAAFVSAPGTVLAEAADLAGAAPTGGGVAVQFTGAPPVIGTIVVLPPSASLPGGFLGRVNSIRADGTALLTAAALDDAFDYYSLDVQEFQDAPAPLQPDGSARRAKSVSQAFKTCFGGSASQAITLDPSVGLGGHFRVTVDTAGFTGIPKGASLDMKFTATAKMAVGAKVSASLKCAAPAKPVMKMLTTSPVPISFYFSPIAEATVTGGAEVKNVGVTATAGFQFAGSASIRDGLKIDGSPIFTASALQPEGKMEGSVGAALGGELIVGPGAGSANAGIIAGVHGKLTPVEVAVGMVFPVNDERPNACLKTEAAAKSELGLNAKAWLGPWDVSRTVTFDFLKKEHQYAGSPWYWPTDCEAEPADPPPAESDPGAEDPGTEEPPSEPTGTHRARIVWDTGTDVDLHVWDAEGNHTYYNDLAAIPNTRLIEDVTAGFGPEWFVEDADVGRGYTFGLCQYEGEGATVEMTVYDPDGQSRVVTTQLTSLKDHAIVATTPSGPAYVPPDGWCA